MFVQVEDFRRDHQLIEATFADEETLLLKRSQRRGDRFARGADRLTEELVCQRQIHSDATADYGAVRTR